LYNAHNEDSEDQCLICGAIPKRRWTARRIMADNDILKIERGDGVGILTLNRPSVMNALSYALRDAIAVGVEELANDPSVRVLILTGAGERAFSAGLDLKEIGELGLRPPGGRSRNPVKALELCPKPIIGAINGIAITGGVELTLACDVVLASTTASFADTHARVGIIPGWGLSQKLSRAIGVSRAKELSLTGNFLDAKTALAWGLVNHVYEPADLLPAARKLAADMCSVSERMLYSYKKLIDDGFGMTLRDALALEAEQTRTLNAGLTAEDIEARRAGVQARGRTVSSPDSRGAR
jgi:enoyl-CoA hydratase